MQINLSADPMAEWRLQSISLHNLNHLQVHPQLNGYKIDLSFLKCESGGISYCSLETVCLLLHFTILRNLNYK